MRYTIGRSQYSIGEKIRTLRENASLSQKELAARLYINHSVVSRLESGAREPRASELKRIAHVFRVPIADLLSELEQD